MAEEMGEFEQLVPLALVRIGHDACGVPIADDISSRTQRDITLGALYKTLKGWKPREVVARAIGAPTPERAGGRKKALPSRGGSARAQTFRARACAACPRA